MDDREYSKKNVLALDDFRKKEIAARPLNKKQIKLIKKALPLFMQHLEFVTAEHKAQQEAMRKRYEDFIAEAKAGYESQNEEIHRLRMETIELINMLQPDVRMAYKRGIEAKLNGNN